MTDDAYPAVTLSTVRALYGAAYRCARPDCRRPLFTVDAETGDRALNSRVAHIHARRRGGPRWKQMPADENRGFDNLLLLCTEHSYEIDDFPDKFPAELLREWKRQQVSDYDEVHNWPLDEDEAARTLAASERAPMSTALDLVRRVEAVQLVAVRNRRASKAEADTWKMLRRRTQWGVIAFDDDGNTEHVEPPEADVASIQARIRATLAAAQADLAPTMEAALVELAALRADTPDLAPWCEHLRRTLERLDEETTRWNGGADSTADGPFDDAVTAVADAIDILIRQVRTGTEPKPEPLTETTPLPAVDPHAEHRALLDQARPHHRVDHRAYDADLRQRLADATSYAASLPRTISMSAIGLDQTAELAVAVARNADAEEQRRLVTADAQRLPAAASVALLFAVAFRSDYPPQVVAEARTRAGGLLADTDWGSPEVWGVEQFGDQRTLDQLAAMTTNEAVADHVGRALQRNPDIAELVLFAGATRGEAFDQRTMQPLGLRLTYRTVPAWLPVRPLVDALPAEPGEPDAGADLQRLLDEALRRRTDDRTTEA